MAVDRVGYIKAARALSFLAAWSMTAEKLGRRPTVVEYCQDWKQSEATAYRELERWRAAFPGVDHHEAYLIGKQARLDMKSRDRLAAGLSGLPSFS